ncbi:hypothetical protein ACFZAR_39270 [Streptomyces sp. NPDC008222]|uniref:hypothetical protein n=1 Tax=Streptomyces sp. NPDC008222 TaxID=3364820 RepID=UPI0036EAF14C
MNPPTQHKALAPGESGTITETSPSPALKPVAALTDDVHPVSATVILLPLQAQDDADQPRYRWKTRLVASAAAGPNARYRVRPRLTAANWAGNIDAASRVADKLVDNAVRHGQPFGPGEGWIELRLAVEPGTDALVIEVDDADGAFPNFEIAKSAVPEPEGLPTGLWWVRHYRGDLTWAVKKTDEGETVGKTVKATLPPTWGESA